MSNSDKLPVILGAGSPILDILISVDDSFIDSCAGGGKGGSHIVSSSEFDKILSASSSERKIAPGGSAANTIFALGRLGLKTKFLGALGDDSEGKFYLERYIKNGGITSSIRVRKGIPTGRCLCMITPDSQRTMRTDLGAATSLTPEEIVPEDFSSCEHLHIEGYVLFNKALGMKIIQTAKERKLRISLDLSSFELVKMLGKDLEQILSDYVDIVFSNEDEAEAFIRENNPEKALKKFSDLCEISVVKLGEKGSILCDKKGIYKVDALPVKALDTTGAGDLWAAGFLYGILNGRNLTEAARFGSVLGAEVVQIYGADIPEPRWEELKQIIS